MKKKISFVPFKTLWFGDNPRVYRDVHIEALQADIAEKGLKNEIVVWDDPNPEDAKQTKQILQGHCRTKAIGLIKQFDPDRFNELFPKGVPTIIVTDCTAQEAMEIKLDHGTQDGLTNWYELFRTVYLLFVTFARITEKQIAKQTAMLMDRVSPLKGKTKAKIDKLRNELTDARDTGNPKLITRAEDRLEEELFLTRRGLIQTLNRVRRSPKIVEASMYLNYVGGIMDGFVEDDLNVGLTNRQIRTLFEAHQKDTDPKDKANTDGDGCPKFNRDVPGPNFWKAWNELIAEAKAKASNPTPRAKALSANAITELIKDGAGRSRARLLTLRQCAGEDVTGIEEADTRAYYADVVAKHDPDTWTGIETRAKDLIAEAAEASKVVAEASAPTS